MSAVRGSDGFVSPLALIQYAIVISISALSEKSRLSQLCHQICLICLTAQGAIKARGGTSA